jgi:TetR/AcrR family transcriptional regulator, regulator of cefoperazone and chloramphenicol sensitivity
MFKTSSKTNADPKEDTRNRILQAAVQLLQESDDPTGITVRQIAARAEVGIGLINYHFGSRDRLFNDAVGQLMTDKVTPYLSKMPSGETSPRERLIQFLIASAQVSAAYPQFVEPMVGYILTHGQMDIPLTLVPLLQEMMGDACPTQKIRYMAYTLVTTMQAIFIQRQDFYLFTGFNVMDPKDHEPAIRMLVDMIVPQEKE